MGQRKEIFYIAREEPHTRVRVTQTDHAAITAFAAYSGRSVTAELHYVIEEAAKCRLEKHSEQIEKLEYQLDRLIALAQEYKKRYGPLNKK
jgi:hypothetical protein